MGVTSRLAELVCRTRFEHLPHEVVARSKDVMLNAAAVALAAAACQESVALTNLVQELRGNGKCTIIGMGLRTSPTYAALVNGALIRLLDFDEEIARRPCHPAASVFPVVMALGEMEGYSGASVLTAFVLGCEMAAQLSEGAKFSATGAPPIDRDVQAGAIGAAAAACKLLELDQLQTEIALGLAASSGGGLPAEFTAASGALAYGRAASNGMLAALTAQQGFPGLHDALEAPSGWLETRLGVSGADLLPWETAFFARLGQPWAIVKPGVTLKMFPCHSASHTAIDAVLQLKQQFRLEAAQVKAMRVCVTPEMLAQLPFARPSNAQEARRSLPYVAAATLLTGQPLLDQFTDEAVNDQAVQAILPRVTVEATETASALIPQPAAITLTLAEGRELRHRAEFARGQPELPLESPELDAKFLYCTRYILPPDHIEESVEKFRDLENNPNITGLASVLGG